MVHSDRGAIHLAGIVCNHRTYCGGVGSNGAGWMAVNFWGPCAFDWSFCSARGKARYLRNSDRDRILDWGRLLADAPPFGNRNPDVASGSRNLSRRTGGDHFVFPPQESGCIRMDNGQRDHQPALGRDDLVPLAIEFCLGHRDSCWIGPVDDWNDAADVRTRCEKARQISGELVTKFSSETKIRNRRATKLVERCGCRR